MKSVIAACLLATSSLAFALTPSQEQSVLVEQLETNNYLYEHTTEVLEAIKQRQNFISANNDERYIIVNLKSYELQLIEHGVVVMNKKIIVGRPSRKTPTFSNMLTHVVLNPYWNVPYSLATRDVIPKIKKQGRQSINHYGYKMIDRASGNIIPFNVNADMKSVRIRQEPGNINSLGLVKFIFGDSQGRAIYLHDTPSKELFDRNRREYSSGCIRVHEPFELAEHLLNMTTGELTALRNSRGGERWVKIDPIKVHVVDWDVFVDSSGQVRYNRDIQNPKPKNTKNVPGSRKHH